MEIARALEASLYLLVAYHDDRTRGRKTGAVSAPAREDHGRGGLRAQRQRGARGQLLAASGATVDAAAAAHDSATAAATERDRECGSRRRKHRNLAAIHVHIEATGDVERGARAAPAREDKAWIRRRRQERRHTTRHIQRAGRAAGATAAGRRDVNHAIARGLDVELVERLEGSARLHRGIRRFDRDRPTDCA